jgi:MFS family permease
VLSSFVNRVGTGLFVTSSMLYFTLIVGLPAARVGAGLTLAGLVGLLAGVPAGDLADRHGPRAVQLVTLAIQTVTMLGFVLVHSWWVFTLVATLDRLADSANNAARGALIARVGGERPAVFRAKLRALVALGVVIGTLASALAIQAGTRGAYETLIVVNAATYVLCGLLLLRVPDYPPLAKPPGASRFAVLKDRPYTAFVAVNGALTLQYQAVSILLPVWIVAHTRAPHWTVSVVFALDSALTVLLMTRIGGRIEGIRAGGTAFRWSGLLFLAAMPLVAVTGRGPAGMVVPLLVVAVGLTAVSSVAQTAAGFALGFGLAPDHAVGQYQGFNGMGLDAGQAVGPVVLTAGVLRLGAAGWLVLGVGTALVASVAPRVTRWAERSRGGVGDESLAEV